MTRASRMCSAAEGKRGSSRLVETPLAGLEVRVKASWSQQCASHELPVAEWCLSSLGEGTKVDEGRLAGDLVDLREMKMWV
jgi:hypothetical protein